MQYEVITVEPHELPEGVNVVIVERDDGGRVLLLTGPCAAGWRMMRGYEASVQEEPVPSLLYAV